MEKIDFVVTWVDGSDPEWQRERARYATDECGVSNSINRYRDWGLMKYWFRGIEKYAPWVNKVYFVTCGQCPEWLNLEHPKLVFVKHEDYIPHQYLPTYNSNVIELFLHKITELSEQFVLFNDDIFLLDDVKENDFFINGSPCETVLWGQVTVSSPNDTFAYTLFNNIAIINKHFRKREVLQKHWRKFFSFQYGWSNLRNIFFLTSELFSGFRDTHLPSSHLKCTFWEVWEKEKTILEECGAYRFRDRRDISHWLIKNWRICQGKIEPRSVKWGKCFAIGKDPEICKTIRSRKYKSICLNDCDPNMDFDSKREELQAAFESILPEKSGFEK